MMHVMKCEVQKDKWVWKCECGRILWMKKAGGIVVIREGDYRADHTGFAVKLDEQNGL